MASFATTNIVASRGNSCSGLRGFSLAGKIGMFLSVILGSLVSAFVYWYAFVRPRAHKMLEGEENHGIGHDVVIEGHSIPREISPDSLSSSSDEGSDHDNPDGSPPPEPRPLTALPPFDEAHGTELHPRFINRMAMYNTHHLVPGAPSIPLLFVPVGMAMPPCPAAPPIQPIVPLDKDVPDQPTRARPVCEQGHRSHRLSVPAPSHRARALSLAAEPFTPISSPTASPPYRPSSSLDLYSHSRLHDLIDRNGTQQNHQAEDDNSCAHESAIPIHRRRFGCNPPNALRVDDNDGATQSRTGRWRDASLRSESSDVGKDKNSETSWLTGVYFPGPHTHASFRASTDRHEPQEAMPRRDRDSSRKHSSSRGSRGSFHTSIRRAGGQSSSQHLPLAGMRSPHAETEVSIPSFCEQQRSPPSTLAQRKVYSRPRSSHSSSPSSSSTSTTVGIAAAAASRQNPMTASQVSSTGAVCSLEGSSYRSNNEDAAPSVGRR